MAPPRNPTLEEATFGLGAGEVRCLLLGLLTMKPDIDHVYLAALSGYSESSARVVFNRAMRRLRRANPDVEQKNLKEKTQAEDLNEDTGKEEHSEA
ncbi:histone h1.3 [Penicillium herquei]|nr:histone h1.3 [Penicillium herquei]